MRITIVDSLNKRIQFLQTIVDELGLEDVHLYHDRAETFGQNSEFRASFNFVTARAVARMNVLAELCLPLVKKDGVFIAMKASNTEEELIEAIEEERLKSDDHQDKIVKGIIIGINKYFDNRDN